MIVVDTNVIVYASLRGEVDATGKLADTALRRDPEWAAPVLWRSEYRNTLVRFVQTGRIPQSFAASCWHDAVALLAAREHQVDSEAVIDLALISGCTAYDCEFVAVAKTLGVPLVTNDKQVLKAFPAYADSLSDFATAR